jgi:hypothetical protein
MEPLTRDSTDPTETTRETMDAASEPFVGRWNRLVSTTNWEKGRIITQWRQALVESGARPAEYSDEAWSRRVGGVTSQHAGRLRRVFQRFGGVHEQYHGLFWSHFFAALDWHDAEMWLEGAAQNKWSVSETRRMRWETLGAVADEEPRDDDIISTEIDEDVQDEIEEAPNERIVADGYGEVQGLAPPEESSLAEQDVPQEDRTRSDGAAAYADEDEQPTVQFVRPFENLADLPEDLAEAFESFKLAILRHKTDGWRQISREDVLAGLDALKELVVAPSADKNPL